MNRVFSRSLSRITMWEHLYNLGFPLGFSKATVTQILKEEWNRSPNNSFYVPIFK